VAPRLVVALGELFVGLATLAAYLFMPLVVAAVLAFVVMSLRNF
jgi:hypothetical protein